MIEGIDVSKWQRAMNWGKAREAGARFAFIRAGSIDNITGKTYTDYQFERNSKVAPGIMPVGYYWFFRPNHSAIKQAEYFVDLIVDKHRQLPAVCDIEVPGSTIVVRTFCEMVSDELGEKIMIYTSPNAWKEYIVGDKSWAEQYPLWIANWWVQAPIVPEPWNEFAVWQTHVGNDGYEFGADSTRIDHDLAQPWLFEPEPEPEPDPVGEYGTVNTYRLNVRNTPEYQASGANKRGQLHQGDRVKITDRSDDPWYGIELYVHSDYLDEQPSEGGDSGG
jgi:hypothetical protein